MNRRPFYLWLVAGFFLLFAVPSAFSQGTAFFYQGQLGSGGSPANGNYNFTFTLYNAASNGTAISGTLTNDNVAVSNGLFMTTLDFGPGYFTGPNLWLDIGVSANTTNFTMLSPLQPVLPVPYAIFASSTTNLIGLLPASQIGGTLPASAFAGYTNTVALTNSANLFSGAFSGNGGSVTNVNVTNLTGVLADSQLPANTAFLNSNQTFTASNNFNGVNTFTNLGNSFSGSFFGNGLVGWVPVSGTTIQAQVDHGYVLTNSQMVTVTLPMSINVGDIVRVAGAGASGWMLAQNAGQSVLGNFLGSYGASWSPSGAGALDWTCIASSSSGGLLAAGGYNSGIYISTDSGLTWSEESVNGSESYQWTGVASSADGTKLVAVATNQDIYLSTDSGSTWTPVALSKGWSGVASSSNGSNLVAVIGNNGDIYVSANAGASWTPGENSGGTAITGSWTAAASSSSGSIMAATYNGGIYSSVNSGTTWSQLTGAPSKDFTCIAMSASGSRLIAAVASGGVYLSTNSGTSWTEQSSISESANWSGVACSSDGSKLVAVVNNGDIYTSSNWGGTWQANTVLTADWSCVASSSSGATLAAGIYNAGPSGTLGIYISTAASQSVTTTGTSGYVIGGQGSAAEFQYIGNSQWMPVSFSGILWAH